MIHPEQARLEERLDALAAVRVPRGKIVVCSAVAVDDRRSRPLAAEAQVGIVAVPTEDYAPAHWWRTSQGSKWVMINGVVWL